MASSILKLTTTIINTAGTFQSKEQSDIFSDVTVWQRWKVETVPYDPLNLRESVLFTSNSPRIHVNFDFLSLNS